MLTLIEIFQICNQKMKLKLHIVEIKVHLQPGHARTGTARKFMGEKAGGGEEEAETM